MINQTVKKSIEVFLNKNNFNFDVDIVDNDITKDIVYSVLNIDPDKISNSDDIEENSYISIEIIFDNIIDKIKNKLNMNDDSLLIKSIQNNILPLYKETYEFFIPKMIEVIQKFSIHVLKYAYNIKILITLLKQSIKEENN